MNGTIGGIGKKTFEIHRWFWKMRLKQEQSQSGRCLDQDGGAASGPRDWDHFRLNFHYLSTLGAELHIGR
jgi:hypothetical protein